MIGFCGFPFTSATGANAHWMPTARASSAVVLANCLTASASSAAPKAMGYGNSGTPESREANPRSRSAPISSAKAELRCRALVTAATCPALTRFGPCIRAPRSIEPRWYLRICSTRLRKSDECGGAASLSTAWDGFWKEAAPRLSVARKNNRGPKRG